MLNCPIIKMCVDYDRTLVQPVSRVGGGQKVSVDDYGIAPACENKLVSFGGQTLWIALKAHTSFLNTLGGGGNGGAIHQISV